MPIEDIDATICDSGTAINRFSRSYNPSDISLTYRWDKDNTAYGSNNARICSIIGRDSNDNYLWGYHVYTNDDIGQTPQISFTQTPPDEYENAEDSSSPFTTISKFTDYAFDLRDPTSDLALLVNDTVEHVDGGSYTSTDYVEFRIDDSCHYVKSAGKFSPFVFDQGKRVELGGSGYVKEMESGASDVDTVLADGTSSLVFIDGTGVGRES